MGLYDEELRAREWVENRLNFDRDGNYNTFEVRNTSSLMVDVFTNVVTLN